nr:hypothetical protein [Cytophagales bacterium]
MSNLRYIPEQWNGPKSRFQCPSCGGKREYRRYIDTETNSYLPFEYGICNNVVKCGYNLNPYKDKYWEKIKEGSMNVRVDRPAIKPNYTINCKPTFVDFHYVTRTLQQYESNSFVVYLSSVFGIDITKNLIETYLIGTSKYWNGIGATIFWQIDFLGEIRTGKVMAYDRLTGKRIKKPFNHINWVHKILAIDGFVLAQCYFGEHLLRIHPEKPVAIVESEKTAIISSVYFTQFVWIASGSLNNISLDKSKHLENRDLFLFPDLSEDGRAISIWREKAILLQEIAKSVTVIDLLEKLATPEEKKQGFDLVDFLTKINLDDWANIGTKSFFKPIELNEWGYPKMWDREIIEPVQRVQSEKTRLERAAQNYPLLQDLIERFSLIEV